MTPRVFNTPLDALCYLTECTLATVEHMDLLTRKPAGEFARQKDIANTGLANLRAHGFTSRQALALRCTRVDEALGTTEPA